MEYFDTPFSFFANFGDAWNNASGQVIKIETRQVYIERGNVSWEELNKGNKEKALELIPNVRSEDLALYQSLIDRKIDFIRCRLIEPPFSDYIKWEIECYHFNSKWGEKIYFSNDVAMFKILCQHDFMVFDNKVAFIHNYDKNGEIQGGWKTTDIDIIYQLIQTFSIIKSSSIEYKKFLNQ